MNSFVPSSETSSPWAETAWCCEAAWTSVCGGVRAIVSEARSRLIYLGAPDGSLNLLHAPVSEDLSSECNPCANLGGHRFWLGPQHHWKWPPPAEWEYAPAISAEADREVLMVHHARLDPAYPTLTREYAWEGRRLRCTVRWADDGRPYFGMHVIAVDTPFVITARLEPCKAAPVGLVLARIIDPEPRIRLPHPAISIDGGNATVRAGIRKVKLGFAPQSLTIGRPCGWSLSVHPGPCGGTSAEPPDHGYLSQVWVGDGSFDFAELEQLTPFLHGDASGMCSSTVFIEISLQNRRCDFPEAR